MIENPEKVAARKAFLMSSVPDVLRSSAASAAGGECGDAASPVAGFPPLPDVSHVRQDGADPFWRLESAAIGSPSLRSPQPPLGDRRLDTSEGFAFGQFSSLLKSHLEGVVDVETMVEPRQLLRRLAPPEVHGIVMRMIEGHDETAAGGKDAFSPRRVFKSFLRRKLESDALEAEARSKNLVSTFHYIPEFIMRSGAR